MSEEQLIPIIQSSKIFTTEVRGTQYTYYLTGPIGQPEEYVDLCNILRSSGPQDEVIIRINSRGGMASSERMIVNAIRESQATVKAFIEYDCMSAATGVFLASHVHGWGEHIQFMAHCSWWGAIGKNPDIKSQTEFGLRQMDEEIVSTYSGLLSPEELLQCNDGKEFWFGAKELEERMENYYAFLDSQPCNCQNPECERNMALDTEDEDEPEFSLEKMIAEAVAQGVKSELDRREKAAAKKLDKISKQKVDKPKPAEEYLIKAE